jgi:predicted N-acyltransferase
MIQTTSEPTSTGSGAKSPGRIETPHGVVYAVSPEEIVDLDFWKAAFNDQRKDHRYYEIVHETLTEGFEHYYFVLEDRQGVVRAIQPFFLVDQDVVAGLPHVARALIARLRRLFPRFLMMKVLMVGCAAGEGHICLSSPEDGKWIAESLHSALRAYALKIKASLVVLKEFPSNYRKSLACFSGNGYKRIASLPMVRLDINFATFDEFMSKILSHATRKSLRRKFKKVTQAGPLELEVVSDLTPYVDELYPLYLQVHERSELKFEKLTEEHLSSLGQQMPDRMRFFIWRREGKAVAFSVCMVHGDAIYDELIGLEYPLALDLHLYFYTLRDIIQWAMDHGCKTYYSTSLNYDPKLHMRCKLAPLDLYVRHTSRILNPLFCRLLSFLEPARHDPTLRRFANAHELWGDSSD